MPPATLIDVARATGLAVSSVADVLRGRPGYSEKTRQRVMDAARKLDFVPNHLAKSLASRKSQTIGIAARLNNAVVIAPMLRAMAETLESVGYMPLYVEASGPADRTTTALRELRNRRVDGIILNAEVPLETLGQLVPESFPVVTIRSLDCGDTRSIVANPYKAYNSGVHWLAQRGHRRIAFFGVDNARVMNSPTNSHRIKIEGYVQGMREINAFDPALLIDGPMHPSEMRDFLVKLPVLREVTAVMAGNDRLAIAIMSALAQIGRSIPGDCSVIGFDNTEFAEAVTPRLTSFAPRMDEVGVLAVQMMMQLLQGQTTQTIEIVPRLIERDSTRELR